MMPDNNEKQGPSTAATPTRSASPASSFSNSCRQSHEMEHGMDHQQRSGGPSEKQPKEETRSRALRTWNSRNTAPQHDQFDDDEGDALSRLASTPATAPRRTRSRSASNLPPPPDGGVTAWTQVLAGWLVIFATWGYMNSFGSFQSYYTATASLGQSSSAISWIGSLQGFLTTAIGAFTGRLLDAGYFRSTFITGSLLQLAGIFAMSASDNPSYWHLMLTQGVMTGLGGGIMFTPTLALVATWFGPRRGLAIGLTTVGNSVGGMIYPIIVKDMIPKVGFAWTARTLGFVNLACYSIALVLLRTRLPPRKSGPVIALSAFKEAVYTCCVLGLFCFVWANYYTFYYIASFGIERLGLSYADASVLVMIINGAGLPARILVPMLADRIGALNVHTGSLCVLAIIIMCWLAVSSIPGLYAFTALCGLVSGGVQGLMPTTIASITKRLDTVGSRLGTCFSALAIATLTGPPLGGAIQAADGGSFTGAQVWAGVSCVLGAMLLIAARTFKVGWHLRAKC